MTDRTDKPKKAAAIFKYAARTGVWICVGLAVVFAFVFVLEIVLNFIGNEVDQALTLLTERMLPVATREFLLWFANDVLPQIAPAIKCMNTFGANWNGLLTVSAFLLAVLSIILAFAFAPRDKKEN
jgi:hypothetical protein